MGKKYKYLYVRIRLHLEDITLNYTVDFQSYKLFIMKDATRQKTWRLFSCQSTFHHGLLFQDQTLVM